jgi:hypothetical protein
MADSFKVTVEHFYKKMYQHHPDAGMRNLTHFGDSFIA